MEKLIRFGKFSALLMALAFVTLQFTACSKDDDVQTIYYSMGFSSMSASGLEFITEMGVIENAFKDALGVSDATFSLNGTVEECDAKVKAACEKAKGKLVDKVWSFDGKYTVTRAQEEPQVVYTYQIVKGK